jgi:hypothetical protein
MPSPRTFENYNFDHVEQYAWKRLGWTVPHAAIVYAEGWAAEDATELLAVHGVRPADATCEEVEALFVKSGGRAHANRCPSTS